MDVQLTFINRSATPGKLRILIFVKNAATGWDDVATAWLVFESGQGERYPFVFPAAISIAASDSFGNFTPQLPAQPGDRFEMTLTGSGAQLARAGVSAERDQVQMVNGLPRGAINASIYKDGRLLAVKYGVVPQQRAAFAFEPVLWITVAQEVEAGDPVDSAITQGATALSLLGVASADIVLSGGGDTASRMAAYRFSLENVVRG